MAKKRADRVTQAKCTGCPVFTLCLGDTDEILDIDDTSRCGYCGKIIIGLFEAESSEVCDELISHFNDWPTYSTCRGCQQKVITPDKLKELQKR